MWKKIIGSHRNRRTPRNCETCAERIIYLKKKHRQTSLRNLASSPGPLKNYVRLLRTTYKIEQPSFDYTGRPLQISVDYFNK